MAFLIPANKQPIADFCKRHHIVKLSFFGSVTRDDFTQDSDIDVLIEFESGHEVGLITLAGLELELAGVLDVKQTVEMRTPADLSKYFREDVVRHAEVQYAA